MDLSMFGTAIAIVGTQATSVEFSQLTWIIVVTSIPIAFLILPALTRANRTGRKKVASLGLLLFVLGSGVAAIAPTLSLVVVGRLLQAGIALGIAGTLAVVASRERSSNTSLFASWASASAIGFISGPVVAGVVLQYVDLPFLFWIEALLGAIAFVLVRIFLVHGRANEVPPRGDLAGGVLLGCGLVLLSWGFLALASSWDFPGFEQLNVSSVAGWGLLVAGFGVVVAGGVRLRANRKFRQRFAIGRVTQISVLAVGMALAAALITNALYLAGVQQESPLMTGLLLLPFLASTAVIYLITRIAIDPRWYRITALIGLIVIVLALLYSYAITRTSDVNTVAWSVALTAQGIGAGFLLAVTNDARRLIAAAWSLEDGPMIKVAGIHAARQLGVAISIIVIGILLIGDALRNVDVVERGWLVTALASGVAAFVWIFGGTIEEESSVSAEELEGFKEASDGSGDSSVKGRLRRRPTAALLEFLRQRDLDPLSTLPMFTDLSESQRQLVVGGSQEVQISAGHTIYSRGEAADALYVIRSGRVALEIEGRCIRRLGRGDVFGESEVLDGSPRQVDAVATRDALLMRIERASILAIDDVSFFRAMAMSLSHRLAEVMPRIEQGSTKSAEAVISLIAGDANAPMQAISDALEGLLARNRTVITPGRVDRLALERAESLGDMVLLVDDPADAEWSSFCRRVADRLIAVTTLAHVTSNIPRGAHVVFVDATPTGEQLTEWFEFVRPASRTLVRSDHMISDLEPLKDRLVGLSLGLVLGGGGARGLAHIGVLDVLTAAGIRVDRIAGTSMGALMGALFACGLSPDEMDAMAFDVMVRKNPMSDYTIPRYSLVRGKRLDHAIASTFGQTRIEALPRSFACVSVDLVTRQQVVHRFGPLGEAVAASSRLPGILPPYRHSLGGVHVDGGLLNNLPVDVLNRDEGPIIAVQVSAMETLTDEVAGEPIALGETIMRSLMMASNNANIAAVEMADLVIQPDTSSASLTEFHRLDAMRGAGQRAAEAALPDIERLLRPN